MYRQSEKNLLNSNTSTCPDNTVNFGLLTAEICWRVWGTPANFNGFPVFAALLHGTLVVGVSQTSALNRGRHLYSAGRPSRWALAHIQFWVDFTGLRVTGQLPGITLSDLAKPSIYKPNFVTLSSSRAGRELVRELVCDLLANWIA